MKDVDGEDVVEVESLDEEPVEHGRAAVLQQHVEALAEVGLQEKKPLGIHFVTQDEENGPQCAHPISVEAIDIDFAPGD